MVADEALCGFLLEEVRERLPLCESALETVSGRRVVVSRPAELFAGGAAMAFVPCPVVEHAEFTPETLRAVYDLVGLLREQAGDCRAFKCFLVFIDTGEKERKKKSKGIYTFLKKMEDPSWRRMCDMLEKSLQALERSTSQINRSTNKLITLRDIAKEREKVKRVTSSTNAKEVHSIQDALSLIEKYMRLNPMELQSQGIKLTNEAQATLENYQRSCDAFYKKCISVEESLRTSSSTTRVQMRSAAAADGDEADEIDENTELLQSGGLTQKAMFENDLHDEIIAERQRESSELAENVKDINEIFTHIHSMVNEQGVSLDTIEGNISTSERATRNGANTLRQAQQYRESSRRDKMLLFCLVLLSFIVAVVVLLG